LAAAAFAATPLAGAAPSVAFSEAPALAAAAAASEVAPLLGLLWERAESIVWAREFA
jgi:hypothetical protein